MNQQYQSNRRPVTVAITKINLIETSPFKPMYVRPYEVNATFNDLDNITNIVAKAMDQGNTSASLIENALIHTNPNILMPSQEVLSEAPIIGGWSSVRFKFDIVVEITPHGGNVTHVNVVQGFSSYLGVSHAGTIDENMELYTNSVLSIRKIRTQQNPNGVSTPMDSYAAVFDETGKTKQISLNDRYKVTKPDDIVSRISALKSTDENTKFISSIGTIDKLQVVNRSSMTPVGHVASSIGSIIDQTIMNGLLSSDVNIYDAATGDLTQEEAVNIDFYKLLLQTGKTDTDSFTLKDLVKISDYPLPVPDVTCTSTGATGRISTPFDTLDGAVTSDASYETRVSILIQNAMSNILSKSVIADIVFKVSNNGGQPVIHAEAFSSTVELPNIQVFVQQILNVFIRTVWPQISNSNKSLVNLVVSCVGGVTTINISIDNAPITLYVYPTFADAKYMPILMDSGRQDKMAESYGEIAEAAVTTARDILGRNSHY